MYLLFAMLLCCCTSNAVQKAQPANISNETANTNPYPTIGAIPPPVGFMRPTTAGGSFAAWLQQLPLKKNKTVYLFNGIPKDNQTAQFAVIDITVGNKDLQQCADAVMRLRAEYLYTQKRFSDIVFTDNSHTCYRFPQHAGRELFDQYLDKVFMHCGTASLANQLATVTDFKSIAAGDVLIKGGFPGHAMQVMDIALNKEGKKIYLLAQSYMPAQDIHVVVNPANHILSPWYEVNELSLIETPEWIFKPANLKRWR